MDRKRVLTFVRRNTVPWILRAIFPDSTKRRAIPSLVCRTTASLKNLTDWICLSPHCYSVAISMFERRHIVTFRSENKTCSGEEKNGGTKKQRNFFKTVEATLTGMGVDMIVYKKNKHKPERLHYLNFQVSITYMFKHPKIQTESSASRHTALCL